MTFQRLQANAKQIELRTYRLDLHFLRYMRVCFSQKKQFNLVVCITFVNLTFLSRLDLFASFSLTCHSNVDKKPRPFLLARIDMCELFEDTSHENLVKTVKTVKTSV